MKWRFISLVLRDLAVFGLVCNLSSLVLPVEAQEPSSPSPEELVGMDLDELLNVELTVTSKTSISQRRAPGIVSVLTHDEIKRLGARDLLDILRFIPGIEVGADVSGVTGISMRGNWAQEGKVLLLIDGHEVNELFFSTIQLGGHYPANQIERVEVIRGPGSAIYGGFAELGVINVIMKKGSDLKGGEVDVMASHLESSRGRYGAAASHGGTFENGQYSLHLFGANAKRSAKNYTDITGETYSLDNNHQKQPMQLNGALDLHGFEGRIFLDEFQTQQRDTFFKSAPDDVATDFSTYSFSLKRKVPLNERLSLTPSISYRVQEPWSTRRDTAFAEEVERGDPDSYNGLVYEKRAEKMVTNLFANYDPIESLNLLAGAEYFDYRGRDLRGELFSNGKNTFNYSDIAYIGQAMYTTGLGTFTLGSRYEEHSEFGSAFVPRLAFTKEFERSHIKLLFSEAFRTPYIENTISDDSIVPERLQTVEIEGGVRLNSDWYLTANLFDIHIEDPIIYYFDSGDAYTNFDETSSLGGELELRGVFSRGDVRLSYSYYEAGHSVPESYSVPGHSNMLLGFPQHKIALRTGYQLSDKVSINPSAILLGEKFGYTSLDVNDEPVLENLGETYLLNTNVIWEDSLAKNLDLSFGIFNILNERDRYVNPVLDGLHAPISGTSREYLVRANYRF